MIHYINVEKKRLCGRNNQPNTLPIVIDYSTVEDLSFAFINCQNQIQDISGLSGLYIAGSVQMGQPSYDLLFLSEDYTIADNVLTFKVDTYTLNYLNKIKKKNTEINLEIGQIGLNEKRVMLRDYALACPRVYVEGLTPAQIDSHEYWTASETQEYVDNAIEAATSGITLSGYVTEEEFTEGLATKQNVIDDENKLSYDLLSGTPTIPTKTSDLENDSDFITSDALNGYATEQYVDNAVSGKADETALSTHTSDTTIHVTAENKTTWDGKQDAITNDNKLDYALLSGTPAIPSNYLSGVSANGTALTVTDKTVNIPKASTSDWGLVKTRASAGIMVDSETDFIYTVQAVDAEISSRQNTHYVITPNNLNTAVKAALTDANHLTLTDAEKTTAQTVLGVGSVSGYATEAYVDNAVSGKQDAITNDNKLDYALISGAPTVPTSTSQLTNDSDFVTSSQMDTALSGKQDLITGDNWLPASYVRMELDPYEYGDPEFTVDNAVNIVNVEALTALSGVDAVSGALSGKQDLINGSHPIYGSVVRMDINHYDDGDPDFDVETAVNMTRDDVYAVSGVVSGLLSSKQDKITNDNKLDYALISGTPATPTVEWGAISGTLSSQTDLKTALDLKADKADVDYISGQLVEVDEMLEEYTLTFTPFFIEAREANANVSLAATGTPSAVYLKYSTDNENWTDYTVGNTITLTNVGDKVYFKGNNMSFTQNVDSVYHAFTCSAKTNVGGNIMSLLDETVKSKTIEANRALTCLFKNNTNIVDASKLQFPATTLRNSCYQQMFYGCTALTTAPKKLPAKEMKASCYAQMFQGCSSLATTPKISANTASNAANCLYGMFRNCTSLTKAPEINVSALSSEMMFNGLFRGCSSLTEIKVHFTAWNDSINATANWVRDVAASGTFYCPSGLDTTTRGNNTVPEGWTVVNI